MDIRRFFFFFPLLWACSSPSSAERYTQAMAAPSFDAAWSLCGGVATADDRADCQQATITRFDRFEECDRVPEGRWREECRFAAAEAFARAKSRPAALRACHTTRWAANCVQHVLDGLAMDLRDAPAAAVAESWTSLENGAATPNAELDFWRSWHRVRIAAQLPMVAEECPGKACRDAGRAEVHKEVERRAGTQGCAVGAPSLAAPGTDAARWTEQAWEKRCPHP